MSSGIRPLSPQLEVVAKKELGEEPKRRAKDIQHIRDWMKKQPHLKARTDDQWIVTFLRGCKFSLQRTKEKLDMYYTMKTAAPEFYKNRDPFDPKIQYMLDAGFISYLPKVDKEGRRITVLRLGRLDPKKVTADYLFRLLFMGGDLSLNEDDSAIVCGATVILDLKDTTLAHAAIFTPSAVKKSMAVYQDAYPFRPKAIHFVNTPSFSEAITGLFLPLMKPKLRKRVIILQKTSSSTRFLPDIVKEHYGAVLASVPGVAAPWRKQLESFAEYLKEDEKYGTDESKRMGKPKTRSDLFGVEGSFRQLVVD
ncbi:retinol-binding protein pinta-like [Schistocerca piceifrons]|uniref:retinol-binding protein pinta-like n=1 Tax=Schistocerca piceifrons TaxID=274613 RepID=UPI001F5F62A6|nr:retinol-binding protein pinta-like [Schistocerca piceifrons]